MAETIACPRCQIGKTVPIIWGLVRDQDLIAADERGEIVLGGCLKGPETHQCRACGASFILVGNELQLSRIEPVVSALYLKASFEKSASIMQSRGEAYISRPTGEWTLIVLKEPRETHEIGDNVSKALSTQSLVIEQTEDSVLVRAWKSGELLLEQVAPVRFAFRRTATGIKILLPRGGDPRKLQTAFESRVSQDPRCEPEFILNDICVILSLPRPASYRDIEYHQSFRRVGGK